MVEILIHTPASGRRILAAGEMLELGPSSSELHRAAGRDGRGRQGTSAGSSACKATAKSFVRGAIEAGHPARAPRKIYRFIG